MNYLTTLKKLSTSTPLRVGLLSAAVAAVALPMGVSASGPSRPTFTTQVPATHITFNSITNNASHGDERNFVQIKDATNMAAGGWTDELDVDNNKEYLVRVYVHNNAAENLNLVATNTRLQALIPKTIGTQVQIDGYISADNATPQKVWDDVKLKNDKNFVVNYIAGSARYTNNFNANPGFQLSDDIVTSTGALLGYQQMDGNIPGCYQYSGIATFRIKVLEETTPQFTVEKKVRLNGQTDWNVNAIEAKPGQKVDYQLGYDNTGETVQNNVIVKDTLPQGVKYVAGSTTLKNASNPNGNGMTLASNNVTTSGINIGNYTPNSNAYVRFSATMPTNEELQVCGRNTLRNLMTVETENGAKTDTVDVIVTKTDCGPVQNECKPGVPAGDARCAECVANQNGEMSDDCIATTLPSTGPAETLGVILAVATLGTVTSFLIKRNRALKATAEAEALAQEQTETTERQ